VPPNPAADAQPVADLKARVEAERAGRPFLLYRDDDDRQRLFCFDPGSVSVSVGRRPPSDLMLDWDAQVSRLHARFEWVKDGWEVVDDGASRNGTFVNEERLSGRRRLNDGDTLRFGTTTLSFRSPEREQSAAPEAAGNPAAASLSTSQRRVLTALCRRYAAGTEVAGPDADQQIAEELFLSAGAVKTHIGVLCAKLGVEEQPPDRVRTRLVQRALQAGLISDRDL
jgi:pSer/pThr/pTyr-binding forkhead associated (FHA) protein